MNNTFYFLRHAKTKVDRNLLISEWKLTEDGKTNAQVLADSGVFDEITKIYASTEKKAIDTALPVANRLKLEIETVADLRELDRDKGGVFEPELYEKVVHDAYQNQSESTHDWETADHARERFNLAVEKIDQENEGKKILIVGHGGTINMYFAEALGLLDKVNERLPLNDFCHWGIIENGRVIRDLGK